MTNEDLKIIIKKVQERKNRNVIEQLIFHDCKRIKIMSRGLFTTAIILDNEDRIISIGTAKRASKDKHDRRIGHAVAITKALRPIDNYCSQVYELEDIIKNVK